jgi:organic radical activating enzyme
MNSERMVSTRKNQCNGVFVDSCNRCWEDEAAGKTSLRQIYNKTFANHFDFSKMDKETFKIVDSNIISMDIKLGNYCNLKCVMCRPILSSSIANELISDKDKFDQLDFYKFEIPIVKNTKIDSYSKKGYQWPNTQEFQDFFNRFKKQLRWISLTGGDPAVNPMTLKILNSIEHPELTTISITTNGTMAHENLLYAMKKFKKVWVNISLEAAGEQNNEIRFPSSWKKIQKNILKYRQLPQIYLYVSHVLQSFSAKNLISLIQWCDQQQIKMDILELSSPNFLVLNSVPEKVMINFGQELSALNSTHNQHIVKIALYWVSKYQYDSTLHQQRIQYLKTLDSIRKTNLSKYYE